MKDVKIRFCQPACNAARWLETIEVENTQGETKKYLLFETKKIKTKYVILSESASEDTLKLMGVTRVKTSKRTVCFDEQNLQLWWKEPDTGEYLVFNAMEVQ